MIYKDVFMRRMSCLACQLGWHPLGTVHLYAQPQPRWLRPWEDIMSVLRARGPLPDPASSGQPMKDDAWSAKYPGIWEMLTAPLSFEKTPREGSTLMLFSKDGRIGCCLNDRDLGRKVFVTAVGVTALLQTLEKGLQDDSLEWRDDVPSKKPGKR